MVIASARAIVAQTRELARRIGMDNSLRARVWTALAVVFIVGAAQTALNLWAVDAVARMVARSTESRRQLDLYQQLDIEVIHYFHADTETFDTPQETRARIGALLDQLGKSEESEDQLVRQGNGVANDASESERTAELVRVTHFLIDRNRDENSTASDSILIQQIRPLLGRSIAAERKEVVANDRELEEFRHRLYAIGFVSVMGVFVVVLYFSVSVGRAVLRPVRALTEGLRGLENGDLGNRIALTFHDEFNRIAESVNHMARELQRKQEKLRDINAHLEKIVQDRTEALKRSNADLKRIDEDRKRFFADVSHELRTPLTTIAAEAEITRMIANGDVAGYHAALETISAQAGFLRRRIDDLLAIARSEHGKLILEKTPLDLNGVARDAIRDVGSLLKANQLTARVSECDTSAVVDGDSRWLRQCVVTLLDNAIKFSRPGDSIEISVAVDEERVSLDVRDYGEGVTPASLPLLFERFYQTESGQRQGGTGIGLSIARWIMEQHGGRIVAINECRGVTIRMSLLRALAS